VNLAMCRDSLRQSEGQRDAGHHFTSSLEGAGSLSLAPGGSLLASHTKRGLVGFVAGVE
jgi:hypothetical protein